jgi:hypothetical protein
VVGGRGIAEKSHAPARRRRKDGLRVSNAKAAETLVGVLHDLLLGGAHGPPAWGEDGARTQYLNVAPDAL